MLQLSYESLIIGHPETQLGRKATQEPPIPAGMGLIGAIGAYSYLRLTKEALLAPLLSATM